MQIRLKQKVDKYLGYGLIATLWPFTRFLGIVLRRDHSMRQPPRRILFIKLLGLGSLIVASEAITAMRKRFPEAKLILLTDANIAAGIAPFGVFDEIYQADTDRMVPTFLMMIRLFGKMWTWRRLWVVDLEVYSKLTTVLALLTLARNRFGFYLGPVSFRKYFNTHNIPFDQSAFLGRNYEAMAKELTGCRRLEPVGTSPRADEWNKPYIVVNNTCSGLALVRRLPDTTMAEICQWVLENTDYRLALLGSPDDRAANDLFIDDTPALGRQKERIVNFAGSTNGFEAYYDFLRESGAMLVTIDSGPLHIARRLGLPTVSVWGPTDPANYLPMRPEEKERHLFCYLGMHCSPCVHRHSRPPCGGDNVCMRHIPAATIIEKIRQVLDHLSLSGRCEPSQRVEPGSPVLVR